MQLRWLGWAGVEIAAQGEQVVIDPLADPLAVFAWLGERAHAVPLPEVVAPRPGAIAGAGARHVILRVADEESEHGLEAAGEACAALTCEPVRS
jgi:hypothetical protein